MRFISHRHRTLIEEALFCKPQCRDSVEETPHGGGGLGEVVKFLKFSDSVKEPGEGVGGGDS